MKKRLEIQPELDPEKDEIIEMMAVHLQNVYSISPMSGKIWAIIVLEGQEMGLTFEYLVDRLVASKSSISTGLNMLLSTEKIYFHRLEGDRKKYFKSKPFIERFVKMYDNIDFEEKIINKIINYKKKRNLSSERSRENVESIVVYMNYLKEMKEMTRKILSEFKCHLDKK